MTASLFARTVRRSIAIAVILLLAAGTQITSAQESRVVVLVRHAEKATDPPRNPELTPEGEARAAALNEAVKGLDIKHVITSQFTRTIATAAVVSGKDGVSSEVIQAGTSDEAYGAVVSAVKAKPAGEAVLIVGHSNTIPGLVAALGGTKYSDLEDHEYDSIFILIISGEADVKTLRLRFGEPNG